MYPSQKFLSTTLFVVGLMSVSVMNVAIAQETTDSSSQQSTQQSGENNPNQSGQAAGEVAEYEEYTNSENDTSAEEWEDTYGSYYNSAPESAGYDISDTSSTEEMLDELNQTTDGSHTNEVVDSTNTTIETSTEPTTHSYPTFSNEEINSLFNVTDVAIDENALAVEPPAEGEEEPKLEFLEEAAVTYRALTPDPVYNYGTDVNGEGTCAGTKEFCARSAQLYQTYREKIEANESITVTDTTGSDYGSLVQPSDYTESVDKMPDVTLAQCSCSNGFSPAPAGYNGVPTEHCGKWGKAGITYTTRPCKYE